MKKYLTSIFVVIMFTAGCAQLEAKTLYQRYYALKADYRNVLTLAVGYKEMCDKKPANDGCRTVVIKIQDYDGRVHSAFNVTDVAFTNKDMPGAEKAILVGISAVTEFSTYMMNKR